MSPWADGHGSASVEVHTLHAPRLPLCWHEVLFVLAGATEKNLAARPQQPSSFNHVTTAACEMFFHSPVSADRPLLCTLCFAGSGAELQMAASRIKRLRVARILGLLLWEPYTCPD